MKAFIKDVVMGKEHGFWAAVLKPLLWGASCLYGAAVVLRRWLYFSGAMPVFKAARPVISIGNITAGGVGKTPLVILIADFLCRRGIRPVVLTRGYMGHGHQGVESDEALMMSEQLDGVDVMVDPDRVRSVCRAQREKEVDAFLLDDGFQHWRLERDLEVVAIDADNPFGNRHLLPRGILREPLAALKRADIFVLTKTDIGHRNIPDIRKTLRAVNPQAMVVEAVHAPTELSYAMDAHHTCGLGVLKNSRVVAMCAIGAPDTLVHTLTMQGAQVERLFAFEDHHLFSASDVDEVARFCAHARVDKVVMTHKDAVKLKGILFEIPSVEFLVLKIKIKVVHGENEFFARIDRLFHP